MQNTITADAFYTNSFGDVVPVMSDQAVLISGEIIFEQDLAEIFEEDIDRTFTLADLTSEQAIVFERLANRITKARNAEKAEREAAAAAKATAEAAAEKKKADRIAARKAWIEANPEKHAAQVAREIEQARRINRALFHAIGLTSY